MKLKLILLSIIFSIAVKAQYFVPIVPVWFSAVSQQENKPIEMQNLLNKMFPYPEPIRFSWIKEFYDSIEYYYPDSIYCLYMFAADNVENSLKDWYGSHDATTTEFLKFSKDTGWLNESSTSWINTNFNLATDPSYVTDQISFHVYVRTNNFGGQALFGATSGGNRIELSAINTPSIRGRVNVSTSKSISVNSANINGLISLKRWGNTEYIDRNGVQLVSKVEDSDALVNDPIRLLKASFSASNSTNQISFFCIGNLRKTLKLYQAVERYLDHYNSGVMP